MGLDQLVSGKPADQDIHCFITDVTYILRVKSKEIYTYSYNGVEGHLWGLCPNIPQVQDVKGAIYIFNFSNNNAFGPI